MGASPPRPTPAQAGIHVPASPKAGAGSPPRSFLVQRAYSSIRLSGRHGSDHQISVQSPRSLARGRVRRRGRTSQARGAGFCSLGARALPPGNSTGGHEQVGPEPGRAYSGRRRLSAGGAGRSLAGMACPRRLGLDAGGEGPGLRSSDGRGCSRGGSRGASRRRAFRRRARFAQPAARSLSGQALERRQLSAVDRLQGAISARRRCAAGRPDAALSLTRQKNVGRPSQAGPDRLSRRFTHESSCGVACPNARSAHSLEAGPPSWA